MALSLNDWFLGKLNCSTQLPPSTEGGGAGDFPWLFSENKTKKILPSFSISCLPYTRQLEILVIALVVNNYFVSLESQCFLRQILERQNTISLRASQRNTYCILYVLTFKSRDPTNTLTGFFKY